MMGSRNPALRTTILRMYDAGASVEEIMTETGKSKQNITAIIVDSGRETAFDKPWKSLDTPAAMRWAVQWNRVRREILTKYGGAVY